MKPLIKYLYGKIKCFRLLLLFLHFVAHGQSKSDALYVGSDARRDSTRKRSHVFVTSALALGYAGGSFACYRYVDANLQEESQEGKTGTKTAVARFVSSLGLGRTNALGLGSVAVLAYFSKNTTLQKTVLLWGGSLVVNSAATDRLKNIFQRHRPETGDPYTAFDWAGGRKINKSFPSAHTSNAFTTATIFATVYNHKKWVPPVAYGMATLIGFSRIYNNAHWASDVMAGAAVGFLSAKAVLGLYKVARKKYILVVPQLGQHSSFSLIYRFG